MAFKPFLMGSETEYGLSGHNAGGPLDPDFVYGRLHDALKAERACVEEHEGNCGLFLEHGGRLYLDYGSHPEHCTAECFTPTQVACQDKAGEHLLALARARAQVAQPGLTVRLLKNNLDPLYPDQVSYGTHESYTCWVSADEAAPQLLPHLVSRVPYAGAGGLSAHPEGMGFELSQRARHLTVAVGDDTTSNRAVFSTRVRNPVDGEDEGWTRVHLIGKDSQRAPFGVYLTFATTGLLIEMINRGHKVGAGLELADPVAALRTFARDPWLRARAPLADGRALTALEVQSAYLEECERALQCGGLPGWAPEAVRHWRETLAELERDPLRLADRLDPYCKLLIYGHELRRAGLRWDDLRAALAALAGLRDQYHDAVIAAVLGDGPTGLGDELKAEYEAARQAAGAGQLDRLRFAVRLQALDVNYHELGGLYDRLHAAGRVRDVVLTPADVEWASRHAPPGGRAALRGDWIRAHPEPGWRGDWQFLWQPATGLCVDLRDPFRAELVTATLPPLGPDQPPEDEDVLGRLETPPEPDLVADPPPPPA